MVCIFCGNKTQVFNSREQKRLKQVWRRRKCPNCKGVFTTVEKLDLSKSLVVRHNSNKTEDFIREKLFFSVHSCLGHRKNALSDSIHITDTIISKLLNNLKSPLLEVDQIINTAEKVLKNFDKAAFVQYKAYNPSK